MKFFQKLGVVSEKTPFFRRKYFNDPFKEVYYVSGELARLVLQLVDGGGHADLQEVAEADGAAVHQRRSGGQGPVLWSQFLAIFTNVRSGPA
jgi:hypothetical protein